MEKNSIPLYLQLEQVIKSKILIGEYMPGDQIPTEKDLCSTYEISSVTARQAILNLVNEGLLIRKQGKGTFVTEVLRERQNIKTLHLMGDINDIIPEGLIGKKVDVLDIIRIKPPKKVAKIFDMDSNTDIIRVRRTRNDDK